MSPVKEADPQAAELDAAFTSAMGAPPKPREPEAPPDTDPEAPFGRDAGGAPIAPHGYTKDGHVRRSNAGRRSGSKDDQARVATAAEAAAAAAEPDRKPGAAAAAEDHSVALAEFGDTVWLGLSALGRGGSAIPVIGRWIPDRKMAAQALMFAAYKPNLVRAVNLAAQHNTKAARFAAVIATGDLTWALTCGLMVMPFLTSSAAIWKDNDKTRAMAKAELPSVAELADQNDKKLDAYLAQLNADLQALTAAAAAEAMADIMAGMDGAEAEQAIAEAREAGIL